ncbi:MAG: hypothetical protein V2A70_03080 [Candidatus Omnitrophota bacterium]
MLAWIKSSLLMMVIFLLAVPVVFARVPAHAHADLFGRGWACDEGFVRRADACVPFILPLHAQVNLLGDGWECQKGYVQDNDGCRLISLPVNAVRDSFGHGWRCRRGYFQDGQTCIQIKLPRHAVLSALGNDWECARGYKKDLNICTDMTSDERFRQDEYYRKLYAEVAAKDGVDTAPCRSGYNKCTSSCSGLGKKTPEALLRVDDLLELCMQACLQGQSVCHSSKPGEGCGQFEQGCREACPGGVAACAESCSSGAQRCEYQSRRVKPGL